jgi:peptidyl-prolyl cis-trans isomerase SurA
MTVPDLSVRKHCRLQIMKLLTLCVATAALAAPAAAQVRDTSVQLDAVVAVVGNVAITRYDLERRLADSAAAFAGRHEPLPDHATRVSWAKATLNDLVDEEVLLAKAKEMGIEVTDADVSTDIENLMKDQAARFPSQQAFRDALAQAGYGTPEEYRRTMTGLIKRNKTIEHLVSKLQSPGENKMPSVVVPEAKVQEEYERMKAAGFRKRSTLISWRQMVIAPQPSAAAKAKAKAKADSIRAELKAGGDFERIAKRETMDAATRDVGGDLGWRKRGDLPAEIERYLFGPFQLRPNEISPVIESPFGYHLIRIDRANPPAEVKVRQILIIPPIDSANVARASQLADSLVQALRKGAPFDSVAKQFHDRAEDAPGLISDVPMDSLPTSYQKGFEGVKKDSIVTFPIAAVLGYNKFVVAQVASVSEPGDYTYDEVKARIRFRLQQVLQTRRYIDQQKKNVYVRVFEDRAEDAVKIFDRP